MSALRLGMCLTGLLLALAGPTGVRADPVPAHNATPGTLTCPGFTEPVLSTSGNDAAMSVQSVGSAHVLVWTSAGSWARQNSLVSKRIGHPSEPHIPRSGRDGTWR